MELFDFIYYVLGGIISLLLLLFIINLFSEGKQLAVLKISILLILFIFHWFILDYLIYPALFMYINFSFVSIFIMLFFLPVGKKQSISIPIANGVRVDERDTMFARIELKPGTENYNSYYKIRPEMKNIDDKLRAMPKLFESEGKHYEKIKAENIIKMFQIEENRIAEVDGDVNPQKKYYDSKSITKVIKEQCLKLGADEVGVALLNKNYVYSHQARGTKPWGTEITNNHKYVIAFSVEMDFDKVAKAPKLDITEETAKKYLKAQDISINLAKFIRDMGYPAVAHVSGSNYEIMLPPVAYDAGLGELGRMNYLISKKFGGRIRLGAVTTDIPLETDKPVSFAVNEFCEICMKCSNNCPSGSISKNKKELIRAVAKWQFNVEQCYSYWRYLGSDCGICMKVCPFSHKNSLIHNLVRIGISNSSFARKISLWGDDFIYGKKIN